MINIFYESEFYTNDIKSCRSQQTAGSHYCCTAQDSLNGDQITAQFGFDLEKPA